MSESVSQPVLDSLQITKNQYIKLKKFREKVQDILGPEHDDFYLVRWLRARQFDIKKAEEMIRKSMAWRKEFEVDDLYTKWKCPEVLEKYDIGGVCGYDKSGTPIWIYRMANLDTKGLQRCVNQTQLIKRYIYKHEVNERECKIQSAKIGRPVDKGCIIIDMEDFGMADMFKPGMNKILQIFKMLAENYPESLQRSYVVNSSALFPVLFTIVKPFLQEETRKRLVILTSDFKDRLLEDIDASELPVHWGGTRVDPVTADDHCSTLVRMGGPIPETYYVKGSQMVDESLVKKVHVLAGQISSIEHRVVAKGELRYTFWTEEYDIKFSVFRKLSEYKLESIVPAEKHQCNLIPEDGVIHCEEPGTYLFLFDNTYSWVHGKNVYYALQMEDVEDCKETKDTDV